MRTALVAMAMVVLGGCAPDVPKVSCNDLPVFTDVRAEYDVNCDRLKDNILLARKIIIDRGIVSAEDFDMAFSDVPVTIRAVEFLENADAKNGEDVVLGTYGPADGIILTEATTALVHEMLHHIDFVNARLMTTHWHVGWEERGFYAAQAEYQHQYRSPVPWTNR